ncbi:glycine betaine ABC transporter substrate-binding protein [Pseudoxanthomonas putridarboris]|uniref:Glycine betaine ABC transporter substrate-binding protein n=1 Tax=Pseudoxanthomonas putridarboris TaxID=752605 RepID=A0ABU9IZT7_9GAMM
MAHPLASRRAVLKAVAGAAAGLALSRADAGARLPIMLGQVSLSFYAVVGSVIKHVLIGLGHEVEVREGPHDQMFPLLGSDSIDLMVAAWLPEGHAGYWQRYGQNAIEVTRLYEGARFYWAVPEYVPSTSVGSIADLGKPEVVQRMVREIQAIGPAATITTASQQAVDRYGLNGHFRVLPGTASAWIEAYRQHLADERWFVFPGWTPQFLNNAGTLRVLRDPLGVLGGINHAALVAPTRRFDALPPSTRRILGRVRLSLDAVNRMDWAVNVDGASAQDAARAWMQAHPDLVAQWLEDA